MTSQPAAERASGGGYPAPVPSGQTSDTFHLYREIDRLDRAHEATERRLDNLDTHGSRGVDGLKQQVEQIRKDFLDHEDMHTRAAQEAATARRWQIGIMVTLIMPLYALLLSLVVR
jgi:hypothetical protein